MEAAAASAISGDEEHDMSEVAPQPAVPEPERPGFQYSLTTLLLLFVVLGSSLAVFGAWGIVVFALTVGLAIYLHQGWPLAYLALVVLCLMCLLCLLPAVQAAREPARRAVRQQPEADRTGFAKLPPGARLFPSGIHRRQKRQADAQLAGPDTAVCGKLSTLQGL